MFISRSIFEIFNKYLVAVILLTVYNIIFYVHNIADNSENNDGNNNKIN